MKTIVQVLDISEDIGEQKILVDRIFSDKDKKQKVLTLQIRKSGYKSVLIEITKDDMKIIHRMGFAEFKW